jgi:hypothetical protein
VACYRLECSCSGTKLSESDQDILADRHARWITAVHAGYLSQVQPTEKTIPSE